MLGRFVALATAAALCVACSDTGLPAAGADPAVVFSCPCSAGFDCDAVKNVCVPKGGAVADAGLDAAADGAGDGVSDPGAEAVDAATAEAEVAADVDAGADADAANTAETDGAADACTKAPEKCNGLDDDCDGETDELGDMPLAASPCLLAGVCAAGTVVHSCPAGKWACSYAAVKGYEEGKEVACDGQDNDCDGKTDEEFGFLDFDAKVLKAGNACGTGACKGGTVACAVDKTGLTCTTLVNAGVEVCDDKDNDCDGQSDEGCDKDGDKYCDGGMAVVGTPAACPKTVAVGGKGDDCSDDPAKGGAAIHPGAIETCDDLDNNCTGGKDEGCDDDNDDYCDSGMTVIGVPATCSKTNGGAAPGKAGNDCLDDAVNGGKVNPGLSEACGDGMDNNCSGSTDEGCAPAGMALIPAGTFWMGCNASKDTMCSANAAENPQHKVTLSAYYMDVTEVTVVEYAKCYAAGKCAEPGGDLTSSYCNWDSGAKKAKVGRDQHPVNCVDWLNAQKYCQWRGVQVDAANAAKYDLPTEAQWEMAARGDCAKNGKPAADDAGCKAAMRTYPWGDETATCQLAVMSDAPAGGCGCGSCQTSAVGSKVAGASPYGLHDMAGSLWEWTRDWYSSSYYGSSPAQDPFNGTSASYRVVRGGNFFYSDYYLRAGYRGAGDPAYLIYFVGLRCSRSFP